MLHVYSYFYVVLWCLVFTRRHVIQQQYSTLLLLFIWLKTFFLRLLNQKNWKILLNQNVTLTLQSIAFSLPRHVLPQKELFVGLLFWPAFYSPTRYLTGRRYSSIGSAAFFLEYAHTYHCIKTKKKLVQCSVTTQMDRTPDGHKPASQLNTTSTVCQSLPWASAHVMLCENFEGFNYLPLALIYVNCKNLSMLLKELTCIYKHWCRGIPTFIMMPLHIVVIRA